MTRPTRRDLLCIGLASALLAAPLPLWAHGGHDHEHDRARRAVERGEALPLSEILARLRGRLDGEIVGVSFERERDRWVYEFRVIGAGGRLTEVYVDAASAAILWREEDD